MDSNLSFCTCLLATSDAGLLASHKLFADVFADDHRVTVVAFGANGRRVRTYLIKFELRNGEARKQVNLRVP